MFYVYEHIFWYFSESGRQTMQAVHCKNESEGFTLVQRYFIGMQNRCTREKKYRGSQNRVTSWSTRSTDICGTGIVSSVSIDDDGWGASFSLHSVCHQSIFLLFLNFIDLRLLEVLNPSKFTPWNTPQCFFAHFLFLCSAWSSQRHHTLQLPRSVKNVYTNFNKSESLFNIHKVLLDTLWSLII